MTIEFSQTANNTPNRSWDWQATFKGYGSTKEEAEEDLLEQTRCDICGDIHYPNPMPRSCETGDGV
jgi:hypothetical protein